MAQIETTVSHDAMLLPFFLSPARKSRATTIGIDRFSCADHRGISWH
jgi:hypothetical protein